MNVLENIIRKALFERKQRLNEAISDWEYDGYWPPRFASKIAGAAPRSLKGFTVIAKGEKLPGELDQGIVTNIAKFLNFAVDSRSDIKIAPYNTGAYFIVLGKDERITRSEKRSRNEINDVINALAFPIDNIKDIIDNKFINYIATNAWKYPSAKGTAFESPRTGVQNFSSISPANFGQSPLIVIADLEELQADYKQLLPIAREMKNTPQPNGDMNRIDDINNAIESMESFLQDWPDWAALSKILSPKQTKQSRVRMSGLDGIELLNAEKWDATDSKQAAALAGQAAEDQAAQSDAEAIEAGNSIVDVQDQEYETTDSPTGKIMFTGKWNLETQRPIDGVATDEAGNTWEGIWNENGQFFTGAGYRKLSNGDEWSGGIIKGFIKGSGEYKSPNFSFIGKVTHENGLVVPVNGNINQKWQSETVPSKFESFKGEIVNGKRYDGSWVRYVLESGKIVEYVYTGTLTSTADGEMPNNGSVTKDGKLFGTYNAGVFTETSKK